MLGRILCWLGWHDWINDGAGWDGGSHCYRCHKDSGQIRGRFE